MNQGLRQARKQRQFEQLRSKVECWCKDFWRPYHGSTIHREEDDGNQLIEKKKSGGHMPLNAAVMDTWKEGKLQDSRRLFGRVFAELGLSDPQAFAEIQDLFGRYGAGDSDYDFLKSGAMEDRDSSRSADKDKCDVRRYLRFLTVERGIDAMTQALIDWGITDKDFWADFGLQRIPDKRTVTKDENYRRYYLCFLNKRDELLKAGNKRCQRRAMEAAAVECEVARSVIQEAVAQLESGYIMLEDVGFLPTEVATKKKKGRGRRKCQSYKTEQDAKRNKPEETPMTPA